MSNIYTSAYAFWHLDRRTCLIRARLKSLIPFSTATAKRTEQRNDENGDRTPNAERGLIHNEPARSGSVGPSRLLAVDGEGGGGVNWWGVVAVVASSMAGCAGGGGGDKPTTKASLPGRPNK